MFNPTIIYINRGKDSSMGVKPAKKKTCGYRNVDFDCFFSNPFDHTPPWLASDFGGTKGSWIFNIKMGRLITQAARVLQDPQKYVDKCCQIPRLFLNMLAN